MSGSDRVRYSPIDTPLGELIAAATDTHLVLLEYERRAMHTTYEQQIARVQRSFGRDFVPGDSPMLDLLRAQLDEYFRGERRDFDVPLHAPGTPFQMKVWDELRRIPPGATTSYATLAKRIGHPTAVRAVARANGDNHIAILIPCHRVIGSDGTMVGYGGGLWRKKFLLELEGYALPLALGL